MGPWTEQEVCSQRCQWTMDLNYSYNSWKSSLNEASFERIAENVEGVEQESGGVWSESMDGWEI
jgi:hypothetical protein